MSIQYAETLKAGLSDNETSELLNLKAHFPFRIVFGTVNVNTKEFAMFADTNKRRLNKFVRDGYVVFRVGGQ